MRAFVRIAIVFAYLAGLSPILIFAATGDGLFGLMAVVFGCLLCILLPAARSDWNF